MPAGLPGRLVVLAAIVLIAGAALCLLHADAAAGLDPCISSWATPIAPLLVIGLPFRGRSSLARVSVHQLSPLDLPAPPPKS
jgi:hypothetical protein